MSQVAVIFDMDGTLCNDSIGQILSILGESKEAFYATVDADMVQDGWDPPLAYMYLFASAVAKKHAITNNVKLRSFGRRIGFYPGVPEFVRYLRMCFSKKREYEEAGISLRFYIVTGGFEEVAVGSCVGESFDEIYGCTFAEEPRGAMVPKSSVTFTEKTRFLFAISKGIPKAELRRDPYAVNVAQPEGPVVPFRNMIYIGDGPSDVPCFSVIRKGGGQSIGVLSPDSLKRGYEQTPGFDLARDGRLTKGPYKCAYSRAGDLVTNIRESIENVASRLVEERSRHQVHTPRYGPTAAPVRRK